MQLLDAAQRELHLRQRLELRPLLGDLLDLFAYVVRGLVEGRHHVADAGTFRLVDGGADVLPFLAGRLPLPGIDHHLAADLQRIPAHGGKLVALLAMHAV